MMNEQQWQTAFDLFAAHLRDELGVPAEPSLARHGVVIDAEPPELEDLRKQLEATDHRVELHEGGSRMVVGVPVADETVRRIVQANLVDRVNGEEGRSWSELLAAVETEGDDE